MMSSHFSKNKTGFDWKKELGLSWSLALSNLLESDYGKNLSNFIEQIYLSDKEIYPIKSRLFSSFHYCSLQDVKIVIIDNNPVKDIRSSGIGRGISLTNSNSDKTAPSELRQFRDCIYSTIYGNQYDKTNFDMSLSDYCDNDMLFLNCSVCVGNNKDYTIIWKNFIRNVIQEINDTKEKVVYLFLTKDNSDLRQYIDENKNKVIVNPFTTLMDYSTVFLELDEYIEDNYPQYNRVAW